MTATATPGLLAGYRARDGARDELVGADGAFRRAWSGVAGALEVLGLDELLRRRDEAERLLRHDGVTYNVYGDPAGPSRPWRLDPIPFVVGSDEWAGIEQGVAQRAELLAAVLADLYGPATLVRRGLVPPEVVYGHEGFLRPAAGVEPARLATYGVDLVRDSDGHTVVLGDYAQAPSGAGYALENRLVVSRVFPSLYRDAQVHRLAPYFRALRSALTAAAPIGVDDPRVVVLTPGPLNETYFEHAYLASNLGYPLVEGRDLTVRSGRLWLQSLAGLERVDVVLRRVDGAWCDPLELRADSQLGVPGLLEVARRGNVSICNAPGSSVVENPGLLAFLPQLAHALLGEPLLLPQVGTWWCGDATGRSHVLANLDSLVIKAIHGHSGRDTMFGWRLSAADRERLARIIERFPHLFVGQEVAPVSTVPTLTDRGIEPRAVVLRSFAVAANGSFVTMAGGLARVAPADEPVVSNQAGALSKDVWVLTSEPEADTGFWLRTGPEVAAEDPAGTLPSRAAENLFWLGRYAERSEATVRLARTVLDRRNDVQSSVVPGGYECLDVLLAALTHLTATYPGFVGDGPDAEARRRRPETELLAVVTDATQAGSLRATLDALLQASNAVRDQLSVDNWLVVSDLATELDPLGGQLVDGQEVLQAVLARVLTRLLALAGLATESMVRDPGWLFMDAGRRLERAAALTTLLRSTLVNVGDTATESLTLESVLVSAESIITYRRRYRSRAQVTTVLDLLLLDATNPRSVLYSVARLAERVRLLPRPDGAHLSPEERLVVALEAHVRLADTVVLAEPDPTTGTRPALDAFLAELDRLLRDLADALEADHFLHLRASPLVSHLAGGAPAFAPGPFPVEAS